MSVKTTIKGVEKSIKVIKLKSRLFQKTININIHNAGLFYEGEVKQSISGHRAEKTSVDTGRFQASVNTNNNKPFESTVKDGVKYGKFLEYGTSKLSPRKHFRNSLTRNTKKIVKIISKIA